VSRVLDSRAYATAIKAAIAAELGPIPGTSDTRVYDYDEVPGANGNTGTQPNIYVVVSLERRYNPNLRSTAQAGMTGWRLAVRANGRTVDEVRWALLKAAVALNENRLTVDGTSTTPIQFESDQAPLYDEGLYTAVAFYTYAH
jgi:hypothetical protein